MVLRQQSGLLTLADEALEAGIEDELLVSMAVGLTIAGVSRFAGDLDVIVLRLACFHAFEDAELLEVFAAAREADGLQFAGAFDIGVIALHEGDASAGDVGRLIAAIEDG